MNIYKIKAKGKNIGQSNSYEAHVIAAYSTDDVVKLAKAQALSEGKGAWKADGVDQIGTYTGLETSPYIILSHHIDDAS